LLKAVLESLKRGDEKPIRGRFLLTLFSRDCIKLMPPADATIFQRKFFETPSKKIGHKYAKAYLITK